MKKEDILNYYRNIQIHYATYHNHKEFSAWGGLVLYVLFCGMIIKASFPSEHLKITAILLLIAVLGVSFTIIFYIKNQLLMKDLGGATSSAAILLQSEIMQAKKSNLNKYMEIEESSDLKAQSSHVLPKILIKKRDHLNSKGRMFQDSTKMAIYTLISVSTFSLILLKWVSLIK